MKQTLRTFEMTVESVSSGIADFDVLYGAIGRHEVAKLNFPRNLGISLQKNDKIHCTVDELGNILSAKKLEKTN